jgi:hypothetical protein
MMNEFLMSGDRGAQLLGAEIGVGSGTPFCRALLRQNSRVFRVNLCQKP